MDISAWLIVRGRGVWCEKRHTSGDGGEAYREYQKAVEKYQNNIRTPLRCIELHDMKCP